jgi:hypothetical protein
VVAGLAHGANGGPLEEGAARYAAGDVAAARALWEPLAGAGDPDALFDLAQLYRHGRGVAADPSRAKQLLRQSARQGHIPAQTLLGRLLIEDGAMDEAARWLAPAALAGDARARFLMGTLYANGDGVGRDPALAFAYLSAARAAGVADAAASLVILDPQLTPDQHARGRALAARLQRIQIAEARTAPPRRAPAKTAKPPSAPDASGAPEMAPWQVQLGAYSSRTNATNAWNALATGNKPELRDVRPLYYQAGAVIRLRIAGGADRAGAVHLCESLRRYGANCIAVRGERP